MIPDERRYSEKWFYQCIQSRYGFNPHHAQLADGIEVFIGQGQKVGMGGHLMGQKVTDQVAEMRSLPAGIDQRSPARHPDWLGPDDLALKVAELRELTKNKVPIQLKLGAAKVYDDVRMAAKCDPDSIYLDGMEGSTGAGPQLATATSPANWGPFLAGFCDVMPLAATGSLDGSVIVWDTNACQSRGTLTHDGGVSTLRWIPNTMCLYRYVQREFARASSRLATKGPRAFLHTLVATLDRKSVV